jgi:site-specific DNA recombinase
MEVEALQSGSRIVDAATNLATIGAMKKPSPSVLRAVLYSRVSTADQVESGLGLEVQRKRTRQYAEMHGMAVVAELGDEGISGASLKRPGIQEALRMVREGEADVLVVAKLDRLTRSVGDLADIVEMFAKKDASLASVSESLDTGSAAGRMMVNLLGVFASFERERIAERVAEAMGEMKGRGQKVSRWASLGQKVGDDGLVKEDETERSLVLRVREMKAVHRMSYRRIAEVLNAEGITTRYGKPHHAVSVHRLAHAEAA